MPDTPPQSDALADTALDPLADTQLDAASGPVRDSERDTSTSTSGPGARYQVIAEHARGGVGRVLRARDRLLERTVAIKEMIQVSDLAELLFMREAQVTARLQHPGIVSVIESGRWPSGDPYYVMELIAGQSLQTLIAERDTLGQRLALLPHVIAVVETIAYAHSQGVIHSDIKPGNVLVGDFGESLVVDWGLARERIAAADSSPNGLDDGLADALADALADGATDEQISGQAGEAPGRLSTENALRVVYESVPVPTESADNSLTGKILGTPAYMAPEQAHGQVDGGVDVYALGALLYELLSGQPPYTGTPLCVLDKLRAGPPTPLATRAPEVPPDLATIVAKAMHRDRAQRYRSAKELAEELRRFQAGQWVVAHKYSTYVVIKRWCARHRGAVGVALTALLLLVALAVVSVDRVVAERDVAAAQEQRARAAQSAAEHRKNQLLVHQAESAIERDPTTAVAWLQSLPLSEEFFSRARDLFDDAVGQGVARHVFMHDSWVTDIAFNAAGTHLVSASRDGTLRLSELDAGGQQVLLADQRSVDTVAISADGAWLASNRGDRDVLLWPLEDGVPTGQARVFSGHVDRVLSVQFTADCQTMISHDASGLAIIWDIAAGHARARIPVGASFAFTAAAERVVIATGSEGAWLAIARDTRTQAEVARARIPTRPLNIALAPDNTRLAIYGSDGFLWMWDIERGTLDKLDETRINVMGSAFPLRFSPGGRYLVASAPSRAVRVWDLHRGSQRRLRGHSDTVFDFAFSADESLLVSAGDDATVWVWDLASSNARALRGHTDDVMGVAISPKGDWIATSSKDGQVRVWPIRAGGRRLSGHAGTVSGMILSSQEELITTTRNGELRRWDLEQNTSEVLASTSADRDIYRSFVSPHGGYVAAFDRSSMAFELWNVRTGRRHSLTEHAYQVFFVSYSADEQWLASSDRGGHSVLWSLAGPVPKVVWRRADGCAATVAPDGSELATVARASLEFWRISDMTRRAVIPLPGAVEWCTSLTRSFAQYSPDGSHVAVAASPWGLLLETRANGQRRWLDVGTHLVSAMRFAPDGSMLAAGVHDRTMRVWDVASGRGQKLGAHRDMIMDVMFSPDNSLLVSASYDHTIRLWRLNSGQKQVLRSHNASVDRLLFSADGSWLLSGSRDRTIRMWDLDAVAVIPDADALRASMDRATTATIAPDGRAQTLPGSISLATAKDARINKP